MSLSGLEKTILKKNFLATRDVTVEAEMNRIDWFFYRDI